MSITVQTLVDKMEQYAPVKLAEKWDSIGLLVGNVENIVEKVMLTLDVTPDVVQQAIKNKVQMIISHHPVIFAPIKNLAQDNWYNKMLAELLKHDISVYCTHTNLDMAKNGVNDVLAKKIGLENIKNLTTSGKEQLKKLVVFVPHDYSQKVADAMTKEGAGHIGNYSDCTFQVSGTGTFKAQKGSAPFLGEIGLLERVSEVRIETVVTNDNLQTVINAMIASHPYEEVAYDVYDLQNVYGEYGLGRIGELPKEITMQSLAEHVKTVLGLEYVLFTESTKKVKTVAVCGGSGSDLIDSAIKKGVDVFISADFKYHAIQHAKFSGLNIIDASHQGTEMPVLQTLYDYLAECFVVEDIDILIAKEKMILKHV